MHQGDLLGHALSVPMDMKHIGRAKFSEGSVGEDGCRAATGVAEDVPRVATDVGRRGERNHWCWRKG